MNQSQQLRGPGRLWLAFGLLLGLLGLPRAGQAQLYYALNDGAAATTTDQLRTSTLTGASDAAVKSGAVQSPGALVLDAANSRLLVADARATTASATNTKIVAVSLASGNAATTLLTPAYITGSTSTSVTGLALDRANSYLYYVLSDGNATTSTDQLRRVALNGTGDVLLKTGFAQSPGALVLDAANNRLLVADTRATTSATANTKIVAVSLASGNAATTFFTPTYLTGSASTTVAGLALDAVNSYLYYVLSDGNATTSTDQLRRIGLGGTGDALVKSGFAQAPSALVLDAANNQLLVADKRATSATTANTKIVAVSLASGNAVSTLLTPAYLAGSASTTVAGLAATNAVPPTVTTAAASTISSASAVLGGNVTADGGATVTDRGVVYSTTNQTPTTSDTKDANASGTGTYSKTVAGLTATTTYYVRAYATNSAGTSYGAVISFTTAAAVSGTTVVTNISCFGGSNGSINLTPSGGLGPYTFAWNDGATTEDRTGLSAGTYSVVITDAAGATGAVNNIVITQPSALSFSSASQTNIACNGGATGTASISPRGGTSPYTYRWSNGATTQTITGLRAGTYMVTVTDANGCTFTRSFNITEPAALTATTSQTDVTTNGGNNGSATITVGGGTPNYTYVWSPNVSTTATASNLRAGTYTVTATDANGCTIARSFTIAEPAAVTVASVTRLSPSPTATTQVRYQVVFSASVTGLTINNFSVTQTGVTGASISSASGSGTTYTVTVNTGTGDGTLRLNVANTTGLSPTVANVPFTAGEQYTITKSFNAAPQLTIVGTGGTGSDVTAFVDQVQVLSGGSAFANGLQNSSFETHNPLANGDFGYTPTGASWTFNSQSGIADQGSAFTPVTPIPGGIAVAFVQSNGGGNGQLQQSLAVPTGSSYQVSFQAAQRVCCTTLDQALNVFLNGVFLGNIQPNSNGYSTFTSATFAVTAPALTASISSTAGASGSTTATSPIPFTVTFSQSATGFTASDLVVAGGTVSGFSGSGTTYTFNVTPSASGTVTVNVPASSAFDGNNTGNTAATQYSLLYAQPQTAAPVVLIPSNGSSVTTATPTYAGNAPAGSLVRLYVDGVALPNTVTANSAGNWAITQPTALAQGSHTVYATAQSNGSAVSANSVTNTFTVDSVRPTVAISSSAGASGSTTSTAPIPYAVTFSEAVTGFVAGDVSVSNGTLSGFTGSGTSYAFNVTPTTAGTATTVNVPANVAQDQAGNGNTAATQFSITYVVPVITVAPATLPNGTVAAAYSQTVTAAGGTAPYTFAITAGALPTGLTLAPTGVLSGTPTASGTFSFTVSATDASGGTGPYSGSLAYSVTIGSQPVTAVPVIITPADNSLTNQSVNISGTAPANSDVVVYVSQNGTAFQSLPLTATAGGTFSTGALPFPTSTYRTYATAQTSGAAVSANSSTIAFTVDQTAPTVAISSTAGASGSTTTTTPISFTVTFSESVTGFVGGDVTVTNGTITGNVVNGSGTTYTFTVTPTTPGTATTVNVPANVAQDQAGNGNTAATGAYSLTFLAPTITVAPASLPGGTQNVAYSASFTAAGGSGTYTYAITSGALPSGLSLAGNTLSGTPTASGTFNFTVTATDNAAAPGPYSGARSYTLGIAALTSVAWNGSVSTDWFNASNWTPNVVPTATIDVTIPTAPSGNRFPAIASGTANARNLALNSGATLAQSDGTLVLAANLTNNGTYQPTGGTVNLGSTALSSILGSSNTRFWNLTVGGNGAQASTSASTSVQRLLTLNGNFATNGNFFTLESNANATALVVNNGSNAVTGNVTVQRYLDASGNTGTSGYRHYASPVGGATVSSLSTSAYGGSFAAQVNALYNTADPNQLTLATYPNVFGYDESKIAGSPAVSFSDFDKGYQSPASLGDALAVGRGYAVQIGNAEKVQFTGPLNNSTQNITGLTYAAAGTPGAASAGWALIGNPYPAPLDWRTVGNSGGSLSGVDGAAYVFQSTSAYSGRYTSFTNNVGASTGLIASGQGFFVHASTPGTTGSVTLTNANRVTSYANPALQRPTAETRPLLRLSLAVGSQPATVATAQDETFLYFETGATAGYDGQYDAYKLANPSGYYLGSVTPGTAPLGLSIDGRAPLAAATTTEIPLWVSLPAGTYSLTATELLNFATLAGGTTVQLRDALLGMLTDLAAAPSYSFGVAAGAPSAGRFSLVFRTSGVLATLPGTALAQASTSLYPNPATSATALSVTGLPTAITGLQVDVVDVLGRTVGQYTLPVRSGSAHQQLATEQLASTLYLLRLTALDAKGQVVGTLPTQRLTLSR